MSETPIEIVVPDPASFPTPEDFVPGDDFDNEHGPEQTGGPGGVVNYPEDTWPEGFDPSADYASPKVEDI